jgi:hypothetical protein
MLKLPKFEPKMGIKKYYRGRGTNAWSFDWVDTPEEASADYFDATKETQKKLNENYGLEAEVEEIRDPYGGSAKCVIFRTEIDSEWGDRITFCIRSTRDRQLLGSHR